MPGGSCVVGDDDQSIYRFRGADNHIMMQFEEDFRDRGARKILMNTNYRSGSKIVDMADVCIRNNKVRFEKEFIAERGREGTEGDRYVWKHTALYHIFLML